MSLNIAFHSVRSVTVKHVNRHAPDSISDKHTTVVELAITDAFGHVERIDLYLDGDRDVKPGDELFRTVPPRAIRDACNPLGITNFIDVKG